jgi:hypothetical protein
MYVLQVLLKRAIFWAVIIAVIVFLIGKITDNRKWLGFYYPDAENQSEYTVSKPFKTLDECSVWSGSMEKGNKNARTECGRKCKYNEEWQIYVCKEIQK